MTFPLAQILMTQDDLIAEGYPRMTEVQIRNDDRLRPDPWRESASVDRWRVAAFGIPSYKD